MRPSFPSRDAICLDCRTALPAGTPCPAGHARLAALTGAHGREELLTEVWGPAPLRRKLREMARAGAVSGGCGGLFDGCTGCELVPGDLGELLLVVAIMFALGVLIWGVAIGIPALIRWRRAHPRPRGAAFAGAAGGHATGRTGTVVLSTTSLARDPLTGEACVGFAGALEHRARWWSRAVTMLRDGATIGFDVVLDSGERVRIPPGPLIVNLAASPAARVDRLFLALYLGELDPARDTADDFDPFLCTRMRAAPIRPGDRIELLGATEPRPLAGGAPAGGYRDPAPTVLVPTGVPAMRRLEAGW